jgi:hypothetical protein
MKYVETTACFLWAVGLFGWVLLAWIFVGVAFANRLPDVPRSNVIIFDASNFTPTGQYYRTQAIRCLACWLIFSIVLPALVAVLRNCAVFEP